MMQSLDDLGNPLPYELGDFECPEGMVCITEDSFNEMLEPYDMEYSTRNIITIFRFLDYCLSGNSSNNICSIWFNHIRRI